MNQNKIKVNICLSKQFQPGSYELLKSAFTSDYEGGIITHKFDIRSFRSNYKKYIQDDKLRNHLYQTLNIQSDQDLESYVDSIITSKLKVEDKDNYSQLEQALHDYLYVPEEGKKLLLEYQASIANNDQEGHYYNTSFNDFIKDKLTNIKSLDDLKPYPQLHNYISTHEEYKDIKALHSALKNTIIVTDIYHDPQQLSNGTELVLNEFDNDYNIGSMSFRSYDTSWDNIDDIQKFMDYNPGASEGRSELFNNGNFCGSTFRDIEFECDLENVKFQNCLLKNVLFTGNTLTNTDFRGAKLQSTAFDIKDSIDGIKLDVYDPTILERIGIAKFDLIQQVPTEINESEIEKIDHGNLDSQNSASVTHDIKEYIQRFDELNQKATEMLQSDKNTIWNLFNWKGGVIESTINNVLYNYYSEEQQQIYLNKSRKELDSNIDAVRQKYGEASDNYTSLSNQYNQLITEYDNTSRNYRHRAHLNIDAIQVSNVITDSTYRPSEAGRNVLKIAVKITRSDLEEFTKSEEINLQQFVRNKYENTVSKIITQKTKELGQDDSLIIITPDASGIDLSKLNFDKKDMSSTIFARCNLSQCNFSNSTLVGTCFEEANVTGTIFHNTTMLDTNMMMISGEGVQFDNATLTNIKFIGANIGAKAPDGTERIPSSFNNATLRNVDMRDGDLNSCNFNSATVHESDFSYANIIYLDANNSDMQKSTFDQVNGYRGNFTNSKLNDSSMQQATMAYTNFSDAVLADSNLNRLDARGAIFNNADMQRVTAQESNLAQASLDSANAQSANFSNANLTELQATQANLSSATMDGANATKAMLAAANLNHLNARDATFQGADMRYANVEDGNFTGANLSSVNARFANFSNANLTAVEAVRSDFSHANLSSVDITNGNMFNANFEQANMDQVVWNDQTNLKYVNIENAQNVSPDLITHQQNQQKTIMNESIGSLSYSALQKILSFANLNLDEILADPLKYGIDTFAFFSGKNSQELSQYLVTAALSMAVSLFLPTILVTSIAAFVVPPVGVILALGVSAVATTMSLQKIALYSIKVNPIGTIVNGFTKAKDKISSSISNISKLIKSSKGADKVDKTLKNTVNPVQAVNSKVLQNQENNFAQSVKGKIKVQPQHNPQLQAKHNNVEQNTIDSQPNNKGTALYDNNNNQIQHHIYSSSNDLNQSINDRIKTQSNHKSQLQTKDSNVEQNIAEVRLYDKIAGSGINNKVHNITVDSINNINDSQKDKLQEHNDQYSELLTNDQNINELATNVKLVVPRVKPRQRHGHNQALRRRDSNSRTL